LLRHWPDGEGADRVLLYLVPEGKGGELDDFTLARVHFQSRRL
jgi:hypothetical protein